MIVEVGPDQWAVWRELRLRSLREDPQAWAASTRGWTGTLDTEDRWRDRLESPGACFVAYLGQKPVGMAAARPLVGAVELNSMWVSADARRSGVGRSLVDAFLKWARRADAAAIRLRVIDGNSFATRFYRTCGFEFDNQNVDSEGCRAMTYRFE